MWYNLRVKMAAKLPYSPEAETAAAKNLHAIGEDEASRRLRVGLIFMVFTLAVVWLIERIDLSPVWRIAALPLVGITVYHFFSHQECICGIAASGYWDPDGCGLRRIQDDSLRADLTRRFQTVVGKTVVLSLAVVGAYMYFV